MYIIKNAFRSITRAKGRNVLIGIIALVIAVSSCLGLSIRQAAESAKTAALENLSVTATISFDRAGTIGNIAEKGKSSGGEFDISDFQDVMGNASSLTLSEYQTYAACESVEDYYYTLTTYVNGADVSPVSDTGEDTSTGGGDIGGTFPSGFGGGDFGGGTFGNITTGDFTVIGYSSDLAMTDFVNGNASITSGAVFEKGTTAYSCIVSQQLADVNSLSLGDSICIQNPSDEEDTYTLSVIGIYTSSSANDFKKAGFGTAVDPANAIYMSAAALQNILDASEGTAGDDAKITGTLSFTYTFASVEDYYAFEEEARAAGLSDSYVISSSDLSAYEESLSPLETLSNLAKWFLIVILAIGGIILVVLNIFNVRERKYEVGVLTAMGMKKWKVAAQFTCEILVVTMLAVIIGAGIGAVSSVPVTNALLQTQLASADNKQAQMDEGFGRTAEVGGGKMQQPSGNTPFDSQGGTTPPDISGGSGTGFNPFDGKMQDSLNNVKEKTANYITEVDSAMNFTVVLQMLLVGFFLTVVSGAASVLFIMRYDPLKILANRD